MLDAGDVEEEYVDNGEDVAMDSGDEDEDADMDQMVEDEVIDLQNDSAAYFDLHKDSIFTIAQHPTRPNVVATGGGDDLAYIYDATPEPTPVLPRSYESVPSNQERKGLEPLAKLEGHTDSVNAIIFTLPKGEFCATAGLDGQVRVYRDTSNGQAASWNFLASAQEVQEINWLAACPSPSHPNSFALGANDGSVWVYEISPTDSANPLTIVQAFYLHTMPSTAGTWTRDGRLLATVSEDGSLYIWDVWGDAAIAGFTQGGAQYVVGLTGDDERFRIEGGLYSVAISPGGSICAVGGADGMIRVVGLPRFTGGASGATSGATGAGAKAKAAGGKQVAAKPATGGAVSAGQAGQILASLQAQSDSVETIAFSDPPLTIMAAGSVDGTIVLFDVAHSFSIRRKIEEAHEEEAVIKLEFLKTLGNNGKHGHVLTSCGNDGVLRRWDVRGQTNATDKGMLGEWKGHRGGGEGGGILGFVQGGDGSQVVTAGDE